GAGDGGEESCGGVRGADEGGPVESAVGAKLPAAVGIVDGNNRDALDGASVGVGDAVAAGRGDDGADPVAGIGRRFVANRGQCQVAFVVEGRRGVDGVDGDGGGLGGGAEGGAAAVVRHVGRAAVGPAGLVPGAEGDPGAHRAVEVGVG